MLMIKKKKRKKKDKVEGSGGRKGIK